LSGNNFQKQKIKNKNKTKLQSIFVYIYSTQCIISTSCISFEISLGAAQCSGSQN